MDRDRSTQPLEELARQGLFAWQRPLCRTDCQHRLEALDPRERLTLDLILAGHPNKVVQRHLGLSRRTVERIRSKILKKMDAPSLVELAVIVAEARVEGHAIGMPATAGARLTPARQMSTPAAEKATNRCSEDDDRWRLLCRDLHDGAAQYLSAALMRLQAVTARQAVSSDATTHLRSAESYLNVALRDIRDVISGQPPACLLEPGLVPALRRLAKELAGTSGIAVELLDSLPNQPLPARLQRAVYRIFQECVNNAVRHSGTGRIRAAIGESGGLLRLEVRDWGRGFEYDAITAGHRGLRGIRDRAALLDGRASIQTCPGWGTLVAVELPLDAA